MLIYEVLIDDQFMFSYEFKGKNTNPKILKHFQEFITEYVTIYPVQKIEIKMVKK